jgi:hypothetical protein
MMIRPSLSFTRRSRWPTSPMFSGVRSTRTWCGPPGDRPRRGGRLHGLEGPIGRAASSDSTFSDGRPFLSQRARHRVCGMKPSCLWWRAPGSDVCTSPAMSSSDAWSAVLLRLPMENVEHVAVMSPSE